MPHQFSVLLCDHISFHDSQRIIYISETKQITTNWVHAGIVSSRNRWLRLRITCIINTKKWCSEIVDFSACVILKFDRWPWKQWGTSSVLLQALCIILWQSSNWNYSPETQFGSKLSRDLEIWWMTLKNKRASLLYCFKLCSSLLATSEFKLDLQSGNAQFGSKSRIYWAMWPWNWTYDLDRQQGISPKPPKASSITSSPYVNSNRSYAGNA